MEYKKPNFIGRTPVYENLEDLVLIGLANEESTEVKLSKFISEIEDCNYLFADWLVDNRRVEFTGPTYFPLACERRVISFILEPRTDRRFKLAEKYEIPVERFHLYETFRHIEMLIHTGDFPKILGTHLVLKKQEDPDFANVDTELVYNQFMEVTQVLQPKEVCDFGDVADWYIKRLRDYEFLGPKIRHISQNLPGKMGVFVGPSSAEYLAKFLRNQLEPPKNWNDFVEGLEPKYRDPIKKVEKMKLTTLEELQGLKRIYGSPSNMPSLIRYTHGEH